MCKHKNQPGGDSRDGDLTHLVNPGYYEVQVGTFVASVAGWSKRAGARICHADKAEGWNLLRGG